MAKTYLLTGGAGFIGSHLAEQLLKQGHKIINIDNFCDFYDINIKIRNVLQSLGINENIESIEHLKECIKDINNYKLEVEDIRNLDTMNRIFSENKIDTVIHIAAMAGVRPSIQDPVLYEEVNLKGTVNILEMMKKYNIKKLVFASSSSVYGNNKKVPFNENDIVDFAISPYAATKKSCEVISHVYHSLYRIDMSLLRFFTVYGPRQRPDLAIHKFTRKIANNDVIPFYGDGTTSRDYTYIDDIIDGVLKSIKYTEENEKIYEIFNLGKNCVTDLNTMLKTIENEMDKKATIKQMKIPPGDVNRTFADISKAKRILGYNPQINFEDGIKKFIKWYRETNI